jgi:DNA-binding transcriptional MerR regulator
MTSDLIPTKDVADRLGVTRRQVHYLIETGRLTPAIKGTGPRGPMFFDPAAVDALADLAQS